jgi:hypothetical protein
MKSAGQIIWKDWAEAAYTNWLFSTNPRADGMLQDPDEDGKIKNTLNFKRTGLKT